jgi:N-acetylglucosaminyl-diphospho-decaprenol L-rhamnosyltransferase
MPQTLVPLLHQVIKQGYDGVYVLDDHSTNCDITALMRPFGSKITLIAGKENCGAGGNRNRILEVDPKELKEAILHFIDADCELVSSDTPEKARKLFEDPTIGLVGGLLLNANGTQFEWNYSPRLSWTFGVFSNSLVLIANLAKRSPEKARRLRQIFKRFFKDFPDPHVTPQAKDVFGVAEGNFFIPYNVFSKVGGFDSSLRYHEAQDLAYKLQNLNLRRRFDPSVVVKHHAVQIPGKARFRENVQGALQVSRKHGLPWR